MPSVFLEELTWIQAEQRLTPDTVVVIPLGAASKEHGPHLLLKNDLLLADYFKQRIADASPVDIIIAPTVNYSYYPAFLEYPGSVSLRLETARDVIIDLCKSLTAYGPKRFYVLNTGLSTRRALAPAQALLAKDGILLHYTDLGRLLGPIEAQVKQQEGGSHADEIETSMMLYIAPATVNMRLAVKDYDLTPGSGLTRKRGGPGAYSPTGIWGDPTLASKDKGQRVVEALVQGLLADIQTLRQTPLP